MLCGSKRYLVEFILHGVKQSKLVTARNQIGARKVIRAQLGAEVRILSVKEGK